MCLGCLPRAFDNKSTSFLSFLCFVADESTPRQYRSKLSRGPSKSRQVSYLSLPRLQETSIAVRFRCTFASCVAWRCLTLTKRDFIVLAVLVSPCVGLAVTGNTAGAKQVLRGHLGGDRKPWVILEKQVDQESPRSFTLPLICWFQFYRAHIKQISDISIHFLVVFPSMSKALRVASLHACFSDMFGRYDMSAWYVCMMCAWCVQVCVFVSCMHLYVGLFFCFSFDMTQWHLRGDFWGVWQLSLRGLSSPVTSSALDEIRRETSHLMTFCKKKHVETAFWKIKQVSEVKWMNRIIFFEN